MIKHVFNSKKSIFLFVIALALVIGVLFYAGSFLTQFFKNTNGMKDFILGFGVFAPIIFILLQVLQVIIAPIPGQLIGFLSGYIFGPFLGTIYTLIGTTIGSVIAFSLARRFGRPFVEKVIDKHTLEHFDNIQKGKEYFVLFMIFLLPSLPDDAVCFIAGLTNIDIKIFALITFLGRIPGFLVLNLVGAGVASDDSSISIIIFAVSILIAVIAYIKKDSIESFSERIINKIKK